MNPFFNPALLLRLSKSYLSDVSRVWRTDMQQLKKYQDQMFRRMVSYAYTVPMYHQKYKASNIHPSDIKGTSDAHKLPFITKDDLKTQFPTGVIPKGFNSSQGFQVCSSGSTGKPLFMYYDMFCAIKSLEGFVRELRTYGGDWKRSRVMLIIENHPGGFEHAIFSGSMLPFLKRFTSLKNLRYLHISEKPEVIMKQINEFQPEFLGSDPNMLRQLAFLKEHGHAPDLHPPTLVSGGAVLDTYTRRYVEQAFDATLYDTYGSTEGGPIAFECIDHDIYHIHSDFVFLEFLDQDDTQVSPGEPGRVVVTRLYGGGTPIIRYTGLEDLATPIETTPSCGITTEMMQHIEGRCTDLFILPDDSTMSPLIVTGIPAETMDHFHSYKIRQFQIVQQSVREIEVFVIIDSHLRDVGVPIHELFTEMKQRFIKTVGPGVDIKITEIDEIQPGAPSDQVKVVVSKVKHFK